MWFTRSVYVAYKYFSFIQSINLYCAIIQRCVLQCGYAESKKKCLKTDLKCVNGWSSSTVQWKRVPTEVSEQQQRNDEQQCPSCAAELTEASVWMIAASETDCMG